MVSMGVREFKQKVSEVLRRIQDTGEVVEITNRGETVARLVPVKQPQLSREEAAAVWTTMDQLADEISAEWPQGVTALGAVAESRRDL